MQRLGTKLGLLLVQMCAWVSVVHVVCHLRCYGDGEQVTHGQARVLMGLAVTTS